MKKVIVILGVVITAISFSSGDIMMQKTLSGKYICVSGACYKPNQTSKMEFFAKIINSFQLLSIFWKTSISMFDVFLKIGNHFGIFYCILHILVQCSISRPPEKVRKRKVCWKHFHEA